MMNRCDEPRRLPRTHDEYGTRIAVGNGENTSCGCAEKSSDGTRWTERNAIDGYGLTRGIGSFGVVEAVILPPTLARAIARRPWRPAGRRIERVTRPYRNRIVANLQQHRPAAGCCCRKNVIVVRRHGRAHHREAEIEGRAYRSRARDSNERAQCARLIQSESKNWKIHRRISSSVVLVLRSVHDSERPLRCLLRVALSCCNQ